MCFFVLIDVYYRVLKYFAKPAFTFELPGVVHQKLFLDHDTPKIQIVRGEELKTLAAPMHSDLFGTDSGTVDVYMAFFAGRQNQTRYCPRRDGTCLMQRMAGSFQKYLRVSQAELRQAALEVPDLSCSYSCTQPLMLCARQSASSVVMSLVVQEVPMRFSVAKGKCVMMQFPRGIGLPDSAHSYESCVTVERGGFLLDVVHQVLLLVERTVV